MVKTETAKTSERELLKRLIIEVLKRDLAGRGTTTWLVEEQVYELVKNRHPRLAFVLKSRKRRNSYMGSLLKSMRDVDGTIESSLGLGLTRRETRLWEVKR